VTSEIQQNRYDQLIRRVAGIIGPGSKVSEVITELFPVFDVENLPAELYALAGTRICMGGGVITSAAAQAPKMGVFNPAGSTSLVTVTGVVYSSPNGDLTSRWGTNTNELATQIGTEIFTDTRFGTQRPVGRIGTESAVALASATGQARFLANTPITMVFPNDLFVLAPGTGFEIGLTGNVKTIHTAIYWRERPALPAELAVS